MKLILLGIFVIFLTSCGSETVSEQNMSENQGDTLKQTIPVEENITEQPEQEEYIPNGALSRPFSLVLRGTLDGSNEIEFHMNLKEGQSLMDMETSSTCLELRGEYYYCKYVKGIAIEGNICTNNNTFEFTCEKGGEISEVFKGTFDKEHLFNGSWEYPKKNLTKKLELKWIDREFDAIKTKAYRAFVEAEIQGREDAENPSLVKFGAGDWPYLEEFIIPWNGSVQEFGLGCLEYYTSYSSDARDSDYYSKYWLLPSTDNNVYVLSVLEFDFSECSERNEDLECMGFNVKYSYTINVHQISNDEIKNVTRAVFPYKECYEFETEESNVDITVLSDRIRIFRGGDTFLLKWDGNKFVAY